MKRVLIAAAALAGAALATGTPAQAAGGCGPGFFRGPYGFCRPFYGPRFAYRPYYRPYGFYGRPYYRRFGYYGPRPFYRRAHFGGPFYGPRRFHY